MNKPFLAASAAVVSAAALISAAPATAATTPAVAWRMTSYQPNAGAKVTVSYTVTHAPAGGLVALQRSTGSTMRRYVQVAVLDARTAAGTDRGTSVVTAPSMGHYRYRVVVYGKQIHHQRATLKISTFRSVYSYGRVSLSTYYGGGSGGYTVVVGGRLMGYISSADTGFVGGGGDSGSCKSVTPVAGIPDDEAQYTSGGTLSVIEQNGDGGAVTVPTRQIVSNTIALAPGAWQFSVAVDGNAGIYWDASLMCWTPTGH